MVNSNEKYSIDFAKYFKYDETSKTNLRWIIPRKGRSGKPVARKNNGQAGNFTKCSGVSVNIEGSVYSIKNIVWVLFHNEIPSGKEVLFLDGNHQNTKIGNLFLSENESEIDFNKYFYYDETSPSCLRWKCKYSVGSNVRHGDVVGSLDGYWRLHAMGIHTKVHRIIWIMLKGEIPEGFNIDHFNRQPHDNRIENLRCVKKFINAQNKGIQINNTTGITGVHYSEQFGKDGNLYQKFTATVSLVWSGSKTKKKVKSYSIQKYGHEEAFKLACEWRTKMIEQLNAQGAGYTSTHGK